MLRCCERLVTALAASDGDGPDEILVEGVWTMALLSYARCFSDGADGVSRLSEDDLTSVQPQAGRHWSGTSSCSSCVTTTPIPPPTRASGSRWG